MLAWGSDELLPSLGRVKDGEIAISTGQVVDGLKFLLEFVGLGAREFLPINNGV